MDIGLWTLDLYLNTKMATRGHWVAIWFATISRRVRVRQPLRGESRVRIKVEAGNWTFLVQHKSAGSTSATYRNGTLVFT
jgi:hypothetical protein